MRKRRKREYLTSKKKIEDTYFESAREVLKYIMAKAETRVRWLYKLEYHDALNMFPYVQPDAYKILREGIKKIGLLTPVLTYKGKVIDGRARLAVCIMEGVEPIFKEYTTKEPLNDYDILNIVVSLNRARITEDQAACVAAEMLCVGYFEKQTVLPL